MIEFLNFGVVFVKTAVAILAGLGACFAALFLVASLMSVDSPDLTERQHSHSCSLWSLVVLAMCAAIIVTTLTGCADVRTLYHACRDGSCR